MQLKTKISLIIGSAFALGGCIKDNDFNVIPELEFVSFEVYKDNALNTDSAKFIFSFKDGDGDIGSSDSSNFNCFLVYEEKNGDSITLFPEISNREYSLPSLTPNATDKNIEGEVSLILKPAPIYNVLTDSVYRYSCFLIDRAGNISNTVSTNWNSK